MKLPRLWVNNESCQAVMVRIPACMLTGKLTKYVRVELISE